MRRGADLPAESGRIDAVWRQRRLFAYPQSRMKRLLAITMMLLFAVPLAAPFFVADATSNLPECCRRNGSHHCAGAMTDDSGSRTFSTIASKCPNFPKAIAVRSLTSFATAPSRVGGIPLFVHPASTPQTEARYRISFARSRQKRGPP